MVKNDSRTLIVALGLIVVASTCEAQPAGTVGAANPTQDSCTFQNSPVPEHVNVVGPDAITTRLRVLNQPDSPVQIAAVDLGGLVLVPSPDAYSYHSKAPVRVDIRNRSDQTFDYVFVNVVVGSCEQIGSTGTAARPSRLALTPGGLSRVEIPLGGGGGILLPNVKLEVLIWISQVNVGSCIYRPALSVTCPPR
jgi:hypothetical protein